MALLEVSGSWAETLPIEVPTLASSETTILVSAVEKTGGSFTSCTITLTDVVSLKGPKLKKLESMFLFVASILREKLLFVSKSRGWRRQTGRLRERWKGYTAKATQHFQSVKGKGTTYLCNLRSFFRVRLICWWILATLCCESNAIDFKKGAHHGDKHSDINAFETFCPKLPIAYNTLQGTIDLTLSLSVTLSSVVNQGSNWPIWQELLAPSNVCPCTTKELQQWTVTSMWPEETISSPLQPWNAKYEHWALVDPNVRQECATNVL